MPMKKSKQKKEDPPATPEIIEQKPPNSQIEAPKRKISPGDENGGEKDLKIRYDYQTVSLDARIRFLKKKFFLKNNLRNIKTKIFKIEN